jgi:hypothetical protein
MLQRLRRVVFCRLSLTALFDGLLGLFLPVRLIV